MNPNVNCGLWVIMLCQSVGSWGMLIVEEAVDMGVGVIWDFSDLSIQCCCEPKMAIKNKIYF